MLIDKEVIRPGTYTAPDLKSGQLRKAVVTSAHIKHWFEQGNKMLAAGLTVPVPKEHDFQANPMTPAEKLENNAGWVKEFKLNGDRLYSVLDIPDDELAKKLPATIRWTSPWFSSFTDGAGRKWDNVISHLALTTRPRVIEQAPFPSIAAAMDALTAAETQPLDSATEAGYTLSRSGLLKQVAERLIPLDRLAFSLYSGISLSEDDVEDDDAPAPNKLADSPDDVKLDKILCDLLCILGVSMPEMTTGSEFKKTLYNAAMRKIKELSAPKPAQLAGPAPAPVKKPANPIVQEQQPMYMSLDDINKIPDETMKNIALSMYNENVKMRGELDASVKASTSLRDAKLTEEAAKRKMRIDRLSRISPRVKVDLETMQALPTMALSLGDNGAVIDPMGQTLSVLEKGLADIPDLLKTEQTNLTLLSHPTDGELAAEESDKLADTMARQMGCPPEQKKAG